MMTEKIDYEKMKNFEKEISIYITQFEKEEISEDELALKTRELLKESELSDDEKQILIESALKQIDQINEQLGEINIRHT